MTSSHCPENEKKMEIKWNIECNPIHKSMCIVISENKDNFTQAQKFRITSLRLSITN